MSFHDFKHENIKRLSKEEFNKSVCKEKYYLKMEIIEAYNRLFY